MFCINTHETGDQTSEAHDVNYIDKHQKENEDELNQQFLWEDQIAFFHNPEIVKYSTMRSTNEKTLQHCWV
jgi:hypothetical protein